MAAEATGCAGYSSPELAALKVADLVSAVSADLKNRDRVLILGPRGEHESAVVLPDNRRSVGPERHQQRKRGQDNESER